MNTDERGHLIPYWIEDPTEEARGQARARLVSSAHRLQFIGAQLQAVHGCRDTVQLLDRLGYHIENYFTRLHEISENAFAFAGDLAGAPSGDSRSAALKLLETRTPAVARQFKKLMVQIQPDLGVRRRHSRDAALQLKLAVGTDLFDPRDAMMNMTEGGDREAVEAVLRAGARALGDDYFTRIDAIVQEALALAESAGEIRTESA